MAEHDFEQAFRGLHERKKDNLRVIYRMWLRLMLEYRRVTGRPDEQVEVRMWEEEDVWDVKGVACGKRVRGTLDRQPSSAFRGVVVRRKEPRRHGIAELLWYVAALGFARDNKRLRRLKDFCDAHRPGDGAQVATVGRSEYLDALETGMVLIGDSIRSGSNKAGIPIAWEGMKPVEQTPQEFSEICRKLRAVDPAADGVAGILDNAEMAEEAEKDSQADKKQRRGLSNPAEASRFWSNWELHWYEDGWQFSRPDSVAGKKDARIKNLTTAQRTFLSMLYNSLLQKSKPVVSHDEVGAMREAMATGNLWSIGPDGRPSEITESDKKRFGDLLSGMRVKAGDDARCRHANSSFISDLNKVLRDAVGAGTAPNAIIGSKLEGGFQVYFRCRKPDGRGGH